MSWYSYSVIIQSSKYNNQVVTESTTLIPILLLNPQMAFTTHFFFFQYRTLDKIGHCISCQASFDQLTKAVFYHSCNYDKWCTYRWRATVFSLYISRNSFTQRPLGSFRGSYGHARLRPSVQQATNSSPAAVCPALACMDPVSQVACIYLGHGLKVTEKKINALMKAAATTVEPSWPGLLAKALASVRSWGVISYVGAGRADPPQPPALYPRKVLLLLYSGLSGGEK